MQSTIQLFYLLYLSVILFQGVCAGSSPPSKGLPSALSADFNIGTCVNLFFNLMITGRPGTGKSTAQMNLLVPFDSSFLGMANGSSTSWKDFKEHPEKC